MNAATERVDPALAAGNRSRWPATGRRHFLWQVQDAWPPSR